MSRLASARVALSFLVAAAVAMLALAGLGLRQVDRLRNADAWVAHTRDVLAQADEVRQLLLDAEAAARGYAIFDNPELRARHAAAAQALPGATLALADLVRDNAGQTRRVADLNAVIELRLKHLDDIVEVRDARGAQASQQLVVTGVGEAMTRQVREALVALRAEEHALLKSRVDAAQREQDYVRVALVTIGGAAFVFLLLAWRASHLALKARAEAERLARIGESRLFSTLQSCGDGLIVTDEGGRVTMVNPIAEALTGWRAEQARGAPVDEVFRIVNEYTRETVESPVGRVLREGKVVGLANHTVLIARDGTERPIDDSGAPIRTDGETIGVILVFRDVTARKLSEQARERLLHAEAEREAAVKANETKDQFLALVSHELRSPLAAIHGWVTLLQHERLPAAEVPGALRRIERNVRQQQRVISDLLDVSRILAGKLEIVRAPVDLAEIVQAAVDECAPFAASREVALRFDRAEARFFMLGDAQRLTQIMSNLLGNAIKFTPSGGVVDVRLERSDGWARIRVSDTGVGMTPEELEHIFERFWQAQRATTRTHGGLGLGLALTKYVIDQHEGEIHAESDGPQRGSTFTVRLPLLAPTPADEVPAPAPGAPQRALHGVSVLLVDDEADARDAIAAMLEHAGAAVVAASSVREALAACERQAVDVVVTDLGMPDEDGFALARAVRAQDGERSIETPLVALTGFVGTQDRSAVRAAGFVMHLEKPVDFEALIEGIRSVTGRRA